MAVRKPLSAKIAEIEEKIGKHQEHINSLKAKKEALLEADKRARVETLVAAMEKHGITVEELLDKVERE